MRLFEPDAIVGVFRGFSASGMEFHADLVLPYRDELQSIPMHGQFVLVQLEHADEAVLGRITAVAAEGRLVSPIGEDYAIRAMRDDRPIPDELRDQYLKYRVDIRVLGVERLSGDKLIFVPSHRRLPHVGAKVALCSPEILREVANASTDESRGAEIGFLAFGEFIYAGDDPRATAEDWMVLLQPAILPRFQAAQLVSRRTFVFARAGFGKSNLIKLLFSRLYATDPALDARGGAKPVGTIIFDPDGEYFWPDSAGRPGLADVDALTERVVIFTAQQPPSAAYGSFVVDTVKLDIRQLSPQRVLSIALPAERQDQQNVTKLKSLSPDRWTAMVDLITANRYDTDPAQVRRLCGIKPANEEVQTNAIIGNMVRVVDALHDPSSQLLRALMTALRAGKLCVVDISQLRGQRGLQLASIVLAEVFAHNQREFTKATPRNIPVLAVLEEAQSVLSPGTAAEDSVFVSWVKEGRKYGLGAVLVTQQPGSIPPELLSQGDNFFVFHLLSAGDLTALKRANAHFSDDLLATLLNEPLVGHGIFWSSAPGTDRSARPYPLPVRVLSFEAENRALRDPAYAGAPVDCYAARLRGKFRAALAAATGTPAIGAAGAAHPAADDDAPPSDAEAAYRRAAIDALRRRPDFARRLSGAGGLPWGRVQAWLAQVAPPEEVVGNRFDWARQVVRPALVAILGPEGSGWRTETRPRPDRPGSSQAWILLTDTIEHVDPAPRPEDQPG
ncbi:MAG TPA: DUF87 domain-containing protein [Trebonia sp.]|nr:DUF87 domain-containing protein [Trebonia sp.]